MEHCKDGRVDTDTERQSEQRGYGESFFFPEKL
jgi:hypothetical protein